jgi:hypothetical protein
MKSGLPRRQPDVVLSIKVDRRLDALADAHQFRVVLAEIARQSFFVQQQRQQLGFEGLEFSLPLRVLGARSVGVQEASDQNFQRIAWFAVLHRLLNGRQPRPQFRLAQ